MASEGRDPLLSIVPLGRLVDSSERSSHNREHCEAQNFDEKGQHECRVNMLVRWERSIGKGEQPLPGDEQERARSAEVVYPSL